MICRVRGILDDNQKNVRDLYNAMSSSLPLNSILVSANYPPFDFSGERVAPRRVVSKSRTAASWPDTVRNDEQDKTTERGQGKS